MKIAIAALAAVFVANSAQASTLTFDSLAFAGGAGTPAATPLTLVSGGFVFTSLNSVPFDRPFTIYAQNDPRNTDPGGASLGFGWSFNSFSMGRVDGKAFDLTSFDVSFLDNSYTGPNGGGNILFYYDGNAAPGDSLVFDSAPGYETFALHGVGVKSVRVVGTNNFAIDNLVVSGRSGVPESATWAMFIGGFGVAGSALRRRRARVRHLA